MRIKTTAVVVAIALIAVIAFSVTGQEEALPVVLPKAFAAEIPLAGPSVVLAVEPIRGFNAPTLLDAARSNDFVTFDALYRAARDRGEDVSLFATLHDLWSWSISDPIGAFYGREIHQQLSRAYPGYATYIGEFRIVDVRGNEFYPTSETRAFLIDRIIEGRTPRAVIADATRRSPRAASAPVRRPSDGTRSPAPAPVASTPATAVNQPASVVARASETAAAESPAVVGEAETALPPVVAATPRPAAAAPVPAPDSQPATAPAPVAVAEETQPSKPLAGRGLMLLIIGLIGVGLLAVILRTPREEPVRIVQPPPANVEPLRKPQTPQPPPDTPRATSSHG